MSGESVDGAQAADESRVTYLAESHQFQIMVNGELVDISTLEAVMFVLMQRYVAMSDVTAEKTRDMQKQVDLIREANTWLNVATSAAIEGEGEGEGEGEEGQSDDGEQGQQTPQRPGGGGSWPIPVPPIPIPRLTRSATVNEPQPEFDTEGLVQWMNVHGLDTTGYDDPPNYQDFKNAQTQISNYVDQLASNNDLSMLSLKTAVNKVQQAMTAADGILQNIKQLMQTLTTNMAR